MSIFINWSTPSWLMNSFDAIATWLNFKVAVFIYSIFGPWYRILSEKEKPFLILPQSLSFHLQICTSLTILINSMQWIVTHFDLLLQCVALFMTFVPYPSLQFACIKYNEKNIPANQSTFWFPRYTYLSFQICQIHVLTYACTF